jgi:uncharacterized membrane protein
VGEGQPVPEGRRVVACGLLGLAGGLVTGALDDWELALLVGWVLGSGVLLTWIWWTVHALDADSTRRVATAEDDSRAAARAVIVAAGVSSLAAVGLGLHKARTVSGAGEIELLAAAMAAVVTAWLMVHTVFVLRYAHLYYGGTPGGIEFPGGEPPAYSDFAYFGFTVGMTFQVSDTAVGDRVVRRTVLRHALLSYLFGTAIIATSINALASFVG